jgi:tetratricopeptide (TPR) repeat protein
MTKRLTVVPFLLAFAAAGFAQTPTSAKGDAYYHFSKGRLLDDQGHASQAIDEYKKALEVDPNNSQIYSEMAGSFLKNNRVREAVDTANQAIKIDPNNIEAHRLLSGIYVQLIGRATPQQPPNTETINSAIHEFEEIVRIDPSEEQAFLMLGRLYQIKGDRNRAMTIYQTFLGLEPGSEEGVTALAKLQMDAGNNAEAIGLLEDFIKQQPDSAQVYQTLGEAYSDAEEFNKAADAFKRASELDPDDIELKKSQAQALFAADRIDEAAKLYEALAVADPDDGVTLLRLGQIYRRQMNYPQARQNLQKAAQSFPDSLEIQFNMVLLDRDEGFLEDSLKRLEDIVKKTERPNGSYSDAEKQNRRVFLMNQGLISSSIGNYTESIRAFTELKSLTDRSASVDALIVDTYRTARNIDKALQYCEQALVETPGSRQLQMLRADIIAEKGRVDEGIKVLEKLTRNTDEDFDVFSAMTNIYQRARKFDDAQSVLNIASRRFPGNERIFFLQGALYEKQKKFGEAEQQFRKALEIDKDNAAVQNYLGFILADRGLKLDEAATLTQKAVKADPTNGAYLDSLGWVYFKMNRLELAEEYLKKAVIFTNNDASIHDHLGDLFFKTKRLDDARREWAKAVELSDDREEIDRVKKKLDGTKNNRAANIK